MLALVIREPWGSLIMSGKKSIETRTWTTRHRGEFLIVESGRALGVAELLHAEPMTRRHERAAHCKVYDRAHAWHVRPLYRVEPVLVRGRLRFFPVDDRLIVPLGRH